MTKKTRNLFIDGNWNGFDTKAEKPLIQHIEQLETCARFVRRLARSHCDQCDNGDGATCETVLSGDIFKPDEDWCFPCLARRLLKKGKR